MCQNNSTCQRPKCMPKAKVHAKGQRLTCIDMSVQWPVDLFDRYWVVSFSVFKPLILNTMHTLLHLLGCPARATSEGRSVVVRKEHDHPPNPAQPTTEENLRSRGLLHVHWWHILYMPYTILSGMFLYCLLFYAIANVVKMLFSLLVFTIHILLYMAIHCQWHIAFVQQRDTNVQQCSCYSRMLLSARIGYIQREEAVTWLSTNT